MGKYVVKIYNMELADRDEYLLSSDYRFYNEKGYLNIECEEDACKNVATHPSYLKKAIFLTFPKQVISPYCADEIYGIIWQSVILWSFYTNDQYSGNVKVALDDTALKKIKEWYSVLVANASDTNRLKTFWNFSLDECLSTYENNSIEQNYLALTIALEALFVNRNENVKKQLINNTAKCLCTVSAERNYMKQFLNKMYNIRCQVAHGNIDALIKLLEKGDLFENFFEYRAVVTDALKKTYGMSKQEIIKCASNSQIKK